MSTKYYADGRFIIAKSDGSQFAEVRSSRGTEGMARAKFIAAALTENSQLVDEIAALKVENAQLRSQLVRNVVTNLAINAALATPDLVREQLIKAMQTILPAVELRDLNNIIDAALATAGTA